jgi:hypothetical protein
MALYTGAWIMTQYSGIMTLLTCVWVVKNFETFVLVLKENVIIICITKKKTSHQFNIKYFPDSWALQD